MTNLELSVTPKLVCYKITGVVVCLQDVFDESGSQNSHQRGHGEAGTIAVITVTVTSLWNRQINRSLVASNLVKVKHRFIR